MTISSRRSLLIWYPVVGWVLLSCVPSAQAQMTVGTTPAAPSTTTSTTAVPSSASTLPSYTSTIVGAPFGTTIPLTTPEPTVTGGVPRLDNQELGVRVGSFYL